MFLTYAGLPVIHGNPWTFVLGMGFLAFADTSIVAAEEAISATRSAPPTRAIAGP